MPFRFETANERWKWFLRTSDYNGWTNWDTWHTALLIDNEEEFQNESFRLVENGASVEQFAAWALKAVVGPTNQQTLQDFSPPEQRGEVVEGGLQCFDCGLRGPKKESGFWGDDWPECPECRGGNIWSWRENDNADTQHVKNLSNHIIEDSKINWQEIYNSISSDIQANKEYEARKIKEWEEERNRQDIADSFGEASDFLWGN